jgi:hypothetical protein
MPDATAAEIEHRRDGDRWLRLHRHADPLIRFRPLADTLTIAAPR